MCNIHIEGKFSMSTQELCALYIKRVLPDPEAKPFVAKLQKAQTRKGKNYFVFRATIPKEIAEKLDAEPGDYLFFKAKKAKWYHMLNWQEMPKTWGMLPANLKEQLELDGLIPQSRLNQTYGLGATNPTSSALFQQVYATELIPTGEFQWK
jgi:hypothetical protein